jgi:hypothetical protein
MFLRMKLKPLASDYGGNREFAENEAEEERLEAERKLNTILGELGLEV